MSALSELALAARDRVADGWCQGAYARNADGDATCSFDTAASVCALGAVASVAGRENALNVRDVETWSLLEQAFDSFAASRLRDPVQFWNDSPQRKHAEVIGLLDDFATWLKELGL